MLIFPQIEKKNTRLSKFQQSQKKFIRFAQSTFFLPNYIFGLRDQKRRPWRGFRPTRIDVKIEIGKASKGTRPFVCIGFHLHIYTLGPFSKSSQVGFPTLKNLKILFKAVSKAKKGHLAGET